MQLGVDVGAGLAVTVGVDVLVGVGVRVAVAVSVAVGVGVRLGVKDGVAVGVLVKVAVLVEVTGVTEPFSKIFDGSGTEICEYLVNPVTSLFLKILPLDLQSCGYIYPQSGFDLSDSNGMNGLKLHG